MTRPALLASLLLLSPGCRGASERAFELPGSAPSMVGLIDAAGCTIAISDVGSARCIDAQGQVRWRVQVCRPVRHRPVVVGGSLWVACEGGDQTAIDLKTGKERWRETARPSPISPLAGDGLRGFLASSDGTVHALDETGLTLWTAPAGARLWAGADVLAASSERELAVFDAATGRKLWADQKAAVALGGDDGVLVAGRLTGDVVAYEPQSGRVRWSTTLGALASDTLSVEAGAVWVGLAQGTVVELDPDTGSERSRTQLPAPLVAPVRGHVAALSGREGCAAVLGTEPLKTLCVDHQLKGSPVVHDDVLLLAPRDGRVIGFRITQR